MDEPAPGPASDRTMSPGRLPTLSPVRGFPAWTHVIAAAAFSAWAIGTNAVLYGIDTAGPWWQGFGDLMTILIFAVLVVVLPPAVALEAWAVSRSRSRWPARVTAIGYAIVAGFVSFVPTGIRFFGDTSATGMEDVVLSLASYGILIGFDVLGVYVACRVATAGTASSPISG